MKRFVVAFLLLICVLGVLGFVGYKKVPVKNFFANKTKNNECISNVKSNKSNVKVDQNKNMPVTTIPVLMYHSIATESNNELRVHVDNFKAQMDYLKNNGYHTLSPKEYWKAITTGKTKYDKPILVTFDDGYDDNYTSAFPVLKENKQKAIIFMIVNFIDKPGFLSSAQIKEMAKNDIYFESHTMNHVELNSLSFEEQLKEVKDSKNALDTLLNQNTNILCYPVGRYNQDTIRALNETGYNLAFTTKPGLSSKEEGLLELHRVRINASTTLEEFKSILEQ